MKIKLLVTDPRSCEKQVLFAESPVAIGRGHDAGVRLADSWVSRCHCQIDEVDGTLVVRDLGSKYGTLVNGQPVKEALVLPGDEITVGLTSLWASFGSSQSPDQLECESAAFV